MDKPYMSEHCLLCGEQRPESINHLWACCGDGPGYGGYGDHIKPEQLACVQRQLASVSAERDHLASAALDVLSHHIDARPGSTLFKALRTLDEAAGAVAQSLRADPSPAPAEPEAQGERVTRQAVYAIVAELAREAVQTGGGNSHHSAVRALELLAEAAEGKRDDER